MDGLDRITLTAPDLYDPRIEELIRPVSKKVSYAAKQFFSYPGDHPNSIFYIAEGRTKHYMDNEDGNVKLLYTLTKGWFFGETPFLLGRSTGLYSQAEIPTRLYLIPYSECSRLINESSLFRDVLMRCQANKTLMLRYETANLTFNSCEKRLKRLFCASVDLENVTDPEWYNLKINYTHSEIGEIIGVARVTVSRQLSEFYNEGFLRMVNHKLQVNQKQYRCYLRKENPKK